MQLKALEIQGFKSFPDKTVLTFGKGITAVVGPNGSGKSNISDAVRWVLGEKSNKSLRGTKMEDVIFNGTKIRKPLGFAEVTLVLDNSDRSLVFDCDEIAVTRRYFRSGESEYQINRNTVRLKDIIELFMDTGLGQDGYSIISQGKISEIVSAKSDERREIFEEAAGISRYRSKKEESERHLKVAEDNLERLLDILSELEKQVEPLRKQSETAKKFLEYDAERKGLEIGLALIKLDRSRDQLREIESKIIVAKNQYDEVNAYLEGSDAEIDSLSSEQQRIMAQIDEIRRGAGSATEEAAAIEAQIAVIRNDILRDGEVIARIQHDISEANEFDKSFDTVIEQKNAHIQEAMADIERKEQEISKLEESLQENITEADKLTGELEEVSARLASLTVTISEKRVTSANMKQNAEELQQSIAEYESRAGILNDRVQLTEDELKLIMTQLNIENDKLTSLQNSESGYAIKLESRKRKLDDKLAEIRKIELNISEKQQRAEMLRNMERRFEGFGNSVKIVMQEAQMGKLRGIIGPVSRILSVEDKYAIAIETALGGALQNIVVDNEDNAKSAIAFLKQRDAGRATFLPLTSVKGTALDEPKLNNAAGFVGYAYKLTQYEERFDGIAKSLLGRIAVVTDLNAGTYIAKTNGYRFKIVTLDGQVINAGGSFTGGSVVRSAGVLTRSHDIETLTVAAEELKVKLAKAETERKTIAEDAAEIEAAYVGLKAEMQTANENIIRISGDKRLKEDQLSSAQSMIDSINMQIKDAESRIVKLSEDALRLDEEIFLIGNEITIAEDTIAKATGGRSEITKRREEQSNAISDGRMAVYQLKRDIEADTAYIADINARREESGDKIVSFKAEIEGIISKQTAAETQIALLQRDVDGKRKAAQNAQTIVSELSDKRDSLERAAIDCRACQKDKYDERERVNAEHTRLQERRDSINTEHDRIINSLLTDFELTRTEAEMVAPKIDDVPTAGKRLAELKSKIKGLGSVNINAIEDYKEIHARYTEMKIQYDDVEKSRVELLKIIGDVTSKMKSVFNDEFVKINLNFSETFRDLFGGGNASLKLTDSDDVLSSGIEILVSPPGKIINNLDSLSGGEKALVAMAIYFAILKVRPAPFCILDEVETALDDVNVTRFAAYMRRICEHTQFIAITHRRGTMEEADVLYGVTMQEEGITKLLVMNVGEIEKNEDIKNIVR